MTTLLDQVTLDTPDFYVPYVRRRNTPAQLDALQQLFEASPHPTRAQRQVLADEIGMELKSVTNWFQNRRQTSRKKSHSFNENNPLKMRSHLNRYRRSNTPFDRSQISLDRIATLSERPSLTSRLNLQRMPLTPRKSNVQQEDPSSPSELWTHMLSSPVVPPSAPDPEEARLAALSSRARILCPLEWACLKARQKKWVDEDADGLSTRAASGCYETVNLESGAAFSPQSRPFFSRLNMTPQLEDVEAAITLLGFCKTRS